MPLQGRRLPDSNAPKLSTFEPGDYCISHDRSVFFALLPHGDPEHPDYRPMAILRVSEEEGSDGPPPVWKLTVHEDETVTLDPSIHDTATPACYHGHLQNGVWSDG